MRDEEFDIARRPYACVNERPRRRLGSITKISNSSPTEMADQAHVGNQDTRY